MSKGIEIAGITIGYSKRCKICNYEHRALVEDKWRKDGMSFAKLEVWLNQEMKFPVSFDAIRNHLNQHFQMMEQAAEQLARMEAGTNPEDAASRRAEFLMTFQPSSEAERIAASTIPVLEAAAAQKVSDVEMLDELAKQDFEIRSLTSGMLKGMMQTANVRAMRTKKDPKIFLPMTLVQLHSTASSELRQNRKTRAELMGEVNPGGGTMDLASMLVAAWDLRDGLKKELEEVVGDDVSTNEEGSQGTGVEGSAKGTDGAVE